MAVSRRDVAGGLVAMVFVDAMAHAPAQAQSVAAATVPKDKQTKLGLYVTPQQTMDMLKAGRDKILFIDVRSRAELQFVGYTTEIDGQVPFVELSEFWDWDDENSRFRLNAHPTFSQDVERLLARKNLTKADTVIVMCRSGDRSARAIELLVQAGFTRAFNQIEGFEGDLSADGRRSVNGWRNAGLPWTYKLDKAKVYIPAK